jgi:hypothetical protein
MATRAVSAARREMALDLWACDTPVERIASATGYTKGGIYAMVSDARTAGEPRAVTRPPGMRRPPKGFLYERVLAYRARGLTYSQIGDLVNGDPDELRSLVAQHKKRSQQKTVGQRGCSPAASQSVSVSHALHEPNMEDRT